MFSPEALSRMQKSVHDRTCPAPSPKRSRGLVITLLLLILMAGGVLAWIYRAPLRHHIGAFIHRSR